MNAWGKKGHFLVIFSNSSGFITKERPTFLCICGRPKRVHSDIHSLISKNCGSYLTWSRGLCRWDQAKILMWGDYSGLSTWTLNRITKFLRGLWPRRAISTQGEESDVRTEQGEHRSCDRSPRAKAWAKRPPASKGKNSVCLQGPQEWAQSCKHSDFSPATLTGNFRITAY